MHMRKVSIHVAQADMSRNFSLSINFKQVKGPFYTMIQQAICKKMGFIDP